jgi:hypothetical protein
MALLSLCHPEELNNKVLDAEVPPCDRRARAYSMPPGPRLPADHKGKAPYCQRPKRPHRRRLACILVTGILSMVLAFDLMGDWLISALRQGSQASRRARS